MTYIDFTKNNNTYFNKTIAIVQTVQIIPHRALVNHAYTGVG